MAYTLADRERWVDEGPSESTRGDFPRDRARLLHSSALRRLGGKTQVVGPGSDDFARTRLTHSLEVAQVGRELATALGCDPDVVDTACLAHDLGHPPFGHNGEVALDEMMVEVTAGSRATRRRCASSPAWSPRWSGRTVAPPGSTSPARASTQPPSTRGRVARTLCAGAKFGVYADDLDVFEWFRDGAEPWRRCIEAQVMDLSDDIAYSVHDVEDAVVGGWLDPRQLDDPDLRERVAVLVSQWYLPGTDPAEVHEGLGRLRALPFWVPAYDGDRRGLAALKNLTSSLIGRFCGAAERATRERYGDQPLTRFAADVVVPRSTQVEIAALKGVAAGSSWSPTTARTSTSSSVPC